MSSDRECRSGGRRRRRAGFSLIVVMFAMVIVSIGLLALAQMMPFATARSSSARKVSVAMEQGQAILAHIQIFIHNKNIVKKACNRRLQVTKSGHESRHSAIHSGRGSLVSFPQFFLLGQSQRFRPQRIVGLCAGDANATSISI